ncbi:Allantoate amidohydrolase [Sporomusa ovata DSM 2662]|uniref:N-carbamoyl-L-amino acid hydrolase n=1 Tax=Sporomusa ovata TaxID=2378 RepID=A0A0U1KY98_9FIRM|nr:Zn-dependent hydrolase [Sporomusa ovata]EQB28820.1 allantoate amidohydrolase [Sporomusa ovata DSM 2662]CQR72245.1 N-carbamoyl-L-amino acid hydrolase [Sporomusa ovata]
MSIDLAQIRQSFEKLKVIGQNEAGGITRISFSPEFRQAQVLISSFMETAGMEVEIDSIGNLIGTYAGRDQSLLAVVSGSHLDTVLNGGAFDGALGIIAAVECVRSWHEQNWRPLRTVQVIAFIEEEGTRFGTVCFGSRAMLGEFSEKNPESFIDASGNSLLGFLKEMGLGEKPFSKDSFFQNGFCFIELHVEQGGILEQAGMAVGVVSAIVGISRLVLNIRGNANHAGTTSMELRQDALVAAASLISYIYNQALAAKGNYVATVGKLDVWPNAENVVPGEVRLTIEIRSEDVVRLEGVRKEIIGKLREIQKDYKVNVDIITENQVPPIPMDDKVIHSICNIGKQLKITCKKMPSWAGHDAMIFAQHIPTGMIFVPSIGGISHSPAEESDWDVIAKAAQLLEGTLKELASNSEDL